MQPWWTPLGTSNFCEILQMCWRYRELCRNQRNLDGGEIQILHVYNDPNDVNVVDTGGSRSETPLLSGNQALWMYLGMF